MYQRVRTTVAPGTWHRGTDCRPRQSVSWSHQYEGATGLEVRGGDRLPAYPHCPKAKTQTVQSHSRCHGEWSVTRELSVGDATRRERGKGQVSIRDRIQETCLLLALDRPAGALLSLLAAVGATSRRRFPVGTPSRLNPNKSMRDGEAFKAFLADEMVNICQVQNYNVLFRGQMHRLEHVLYKWLRCELVHAGGLPADVTLVPSTEPGSMSLAVDPVKGLTLSHGWFNGIAHVVIHAPENRDEFGDPPTAPFPFSVTFCGQEMTVGHAAQ